MDRKLARENYQEKKYFISQIEKEIAIGLSSPISPRAHKEIFRNLKEKYTII